MIIINEKYLTKPSRELIEAMEYEFNKLVVRKMEEDKNIETMTQAAHIADFSDLGQQNALVMEETTYNEAIELISKICNLTQLGCLYYDVDYQKASASEKENARAKMKYQLKKPSPKTIARLNDVFSPGIILLSDQQIKNFGKTE